MQTTTTNYQQQATEFAVKHGITLKVGSSQFKDFWKEGKSRWVFNCKLSCAGQ